MGATALLLAAALAAGGTWPPARHHLDPASPHPLAVAQDLQQPAPPSRPQAAAEVIVDIRFRGNYSLADELLRAAVGVQPGDPLTAETLAQIEQRLLALEGVGSVEILKRYRSITRSNEVVLLVNVQEQVAVSEKLMFLPHFTWTDEYGITFGASVATVNLLGMDERIAFPLTWGGERRAAAEVGVALDRAAVTRVAGGFGILQRENPHFELSERRTGAWLEATRRWRLFELGSSLTAEQVGFAGGIENQIELGAHAVLDTRQDEQLPRDAFYVGGAWDHLALLTRDESFNRTTADLRGYKTFIGRTILAVQAYWRGADGRLPDWERPFLGGARTLRGYDAGELIGDNIALGALEWRVPITPPVPVGLVGLNFFFDTGAVYDWGVPLRKAQFRHGVGAGVYFFVAFVGLQVDMAYGLASEEVHFHFSTGFRF